MGSSDRRFDKLAVKNGKGMPREGGGTERIESGTRTAESPSAE